MTIENAQTDIPRRAPPTCSRRSRDNLSVWTRQPEVAQVEALPIVLSTQDEVARFDIAMHHPFLVNMLEDV